ncbi:PilZ domain-containing protein [Atopomonas sediminilitoris]|uniref:PilZ domain-containing protein n=1 Tax=Atopomonas sediminilitoris TaxID=2919919 RepID=UPI001F4E2C65|nr:PilZ domain-containing protein [Atopomonas sediminilitoris]MCJ8167708.1 PilZ domain-containing protein [Atopomonas sediminilitoris]
MSKLTPDERRDFFRIADTIALEFTPIDSMEHANEVFKTSPLFHLLGELHLLDFDSQHLYRSINERDRTLAAYLKIINKRIELLGQALAQSFLGGKGHQHEVTLSEGGMGWIQSEAITCGQLLALKLLLQPQAIGLLLQGEVVYCSESSPGQFTIGCEFKDLSEAQRQLLARHILQKQASDRRVELERNKQ